MYLCHFELSTQASLTDSKSCDFFFFFFLGCLILLEHYLYHRSIFILSYNGYNYDQKIKPYLPCIQFAVSTKIMNVKYLKLVLPILHSLPPPLFFSLSSVSLSLSIFLPFIFLIFTVKRFRYLCLDLKKKKLTIKCYLHIFIILMKTLFYFIY